MGVIVKFELKVQKYTCCAVSASAKLKLCIEKNPLLFLLSVESLSGSVENSGDSGRLRHRR